MVNPDEGEDGGATIFACPRDDCPHEYPTAEAWEVHLIRHHYAKERDYRDPTRDPISHKRVDDAEADADADADTEAGGGF